MGKLHEIGILIYDRDTYKAAMADDLGVSRNHFDKMLMTPETDWPESFRLQLKGFIFEKVSEMEKRLSDLNKHI